MNLGVPLSVCTVVAGIPLVIVTTLLASTESSAATPSTTCTVEANPPGNSEPTVGSPLSSGQIANAATIVAVAKSLHMTQVAAAIAIMTAQRESGLLNLDHGDLDSLGLFQQRPSQGWGTPAQILNPTYAATAFFTRLAAVPDWSAMPMAQAAQIVQQSSDGPAYQQWASFGTAVASALWNGAAGQLICTDPTNATLQPGTTAIAQAVLTFAEAQLGKPYVYGAEGPDAYDCSGLTLRAYEAAGIGLPRISQEQWSAGPRVPDDQLEPGDLVFFDPDATGRPGHVGIYVGNGDMIDAPNSQSVVRVEPVAGFGTYMGAVRPGADSEVSTTAGINPFDPGSTA